MIGLQYDAPYRGHRINLFLQVSHKIQNDMFSIIRCFVAWLLDFARKRDR